jgi:predicted RNA-binding Zn ribbon-like protein
MLVSTLSERPHPHSVDLETALEFVNSLALAHGEPVDHFGSSGAAISWLAEHGLLHDVAVAAPDEALARIRQTRAALREVLDATYEGRAPSEAAITGINEALRAREILELIASADGLRLDHRHADDPIAEALARISEPIVREVASGRPDRLRACANDACRWIFYDASPTGRRRWCDMASCGNRAKAARHRVRARRAAEAGNPDLWRPPAARRSRVVKT